MFFARYETEEVLEDMNVSIEGGYRLHFTASPAPGRRAILARLIEKGLLNTIFEKAKKNTPDDWIVQTNPKGEVRYVDLKGVRQMIAEKQSLKKDDPSIEDQAQRVLDIARRFYQDAPDNMTVLGVALYGPDDQRLLHHEERGIPFTNDAFLAKTQSQIANLLLKKAERQL